ncbi:hypothetical protein ACFPM0_31450 [Pseudonocardia sulfidoxydans]|uniref:hypothetical protein n=1 Tax=Pseudonocardia sulfidoxydans TaxID=54011 RepID=UPI003607D505
MYSWLRDEIRRAQAGTALRSVAGRPGQVATPRPSTATPTISPPSIDGPRRSSCNVLPDRSDNHPVRGTDPADRRGASLIRGPCRFERVDHGAALVQTGAERPRQTPRSHS